MENFIKLKKKERKKDNCWESERFRYIVKYLLNIQEWMSREDDQLQINKQ